MQVSAHVRKKHAIFMEQFFSTDSENKGRVKDSAIAAGYCEKTAYREGMRVLKSYCDHNTFGEILPTAGITKALIAVRFREILDRGSDKDVAAIGKICLAAMGERVEEKSGGNVNIASAQVMVIQGMSEEKLERLKNQCVQPALLKS